MKLDLKYGTTSKPCHLPENILVKVLHPKQDVSVPLASEEICRSLVNPIGAERLSRLVKPGMKIVIITSDITRPVPSRIIIPQILKELRNAGVSNSDVTIVFATGSHRTQTEEEHRLLVGDEVYESCRCMDHNPMDCVHLGYIPEGTPIDFFRPVVEADFRICVGNIEYHYFAGYSGGYKAIMPGVSAIKSVQTNHSKMIFPGASTGNIIDNPVRQDLEAAAMFCPADYIVNVILNEKKEILHCVSGHYIKAHREGCVYIDEYYRFPISWKADIVIVSAGGFPKDINMYQAQKALDNARYAVRDGGIIIWVAECREGFGNKVFEEWILKYGREDLIERIHTNFTLGGHKAAMIAMVERRAIIYLVSSMDSEVIRSVGIEPYSEVDEALQAAMEVLGDDVKALIMPCGGSTFPCLSGKGDSEMFAERDNFIAWKEDDYAESR